MPKNQTENNDLQTSMNMKAWDNPYNLAHEYSGRWIIRAPRQFYGVDATNKDTPDVMNENILKCSWSKNFLAFRLANELSNMSIYIYCISKIDCYILDAPVSIRLNIKQGFSECFNISTVVEHMIPFASF